MPNIAKVDRIALFIGPYERHWEAIYAHMNRFNVTKQELNNILRNKLFDCQDRYYWMR